MIFNPEKILIFNIYADYAQFKKYFTNMSPLTFSIPPRTVIAGILGAMTGIEKDRNPEFFSYENSFIALKINRPIKKAKLPTNYIKTTKKDHFAKFDQHKPTNVEYLKSPSFTIYVSHQDHDLYKILKNNLKQHKSVYTLSLGISSCIANFTFIDEFKVTSKKGRAEITSVIPKKGIKDIVLNDDIMLQQVTLPNYMVNSREVIEYKEFLYDVNGNNITGDIEKYYYIPDRGENIVGM